MRNQSLPEVLRPCLLARPEPFADESAASWVQRISGAHQYSLRRLSEITNIHPKGADWDADVTNAQWSNFLRLADAKEGSCGEARFAINTLHDRLPYRKHLRKANSLPCYRWCPACLSSDVAPYLRWHWRLAASTHCQVHRRRLEERCQWCKSPLRLHRALLVGGGSAMGLADLSGCGTCGMPLTAEMFAELEDEQEARCHDQISQLVAQLREAYWRDEEQLELDFSQYDDALTQQASSSIAAQRGAFWFDHRIRRIPDPKHQTFQLNGQSFARGGAAPTSERRPFRWTDGLRANDRFKLAVALQVIRKEKWALRAADSSIASSVKTSGAP